MKKIITLLSIAVLTLIIALCIKMNISDEKLYGLTIDDGWYETAYVEDIILSLKKLKVKPTVRIVMSKDIHPKDYVDLFQKLHSVAYIMAEPVDSYEMNMYKDVQSYKERFLESDKYLGEYVDIWEIGNEVNGTEWIGQPDSLIIAKIMAVYDIFKDTDKKTAITFYYENPSYQRDMMDWIKRNIPETLRLQLDYGFISYYEDENEGYEPDWERVFNEFQSLFPNSKTGIGECGNIAYDADEESKIEMFNKYYTMPSFTRNFVGGYFWWNYVGDCVPIKDNKIYQAVYSHFK